MSLRAIASSFSTVIYNTALSSLSGVVRYDLRLSTWIRVVPVLQLWSSDESSVLAARVWTYTYIPRIILPDGPRGLVGQGQLHRGSA